MPNCTCKYKYRGFFWHNVSAKNALPLQRMDRISARLATSLGLYAVLLLPMLVGGCAVFNPAEELPIYITLQSPGTQVRDGESFVSRIGVRDAWLDQGDGSIGIFKFPVTVPVYPSEGNEVIVSGGILNSGLGLSRNKYPFWIPQAIDISNVKALDTLIIEPVFKYVDQDSLLYFPVNEDFESSAISLEALTELDGVAPLIRTASDKYQGKYAGEVELTSLNTKLELESKNSFFVPRTANNDSYVEITYKGDLPFSVGLKTSAGELTDNILFYSEEWTTVYVHIGQFVRQAGINDNVVLFFRGSGTAGQRIVLDNIRIVQFK